MDNRAMWDFSGGSSACTSAEHPVDVDQMLADMEEFRDWFAKAAGIPERYMVANEQCASEMRLKSRQGPLLDGAVKVIETKMPLKTRVQARTHRRKRINKKWLKRYGTIEVDAVYLLNMDESNRMTRDLMTGLWKGEKDGQ